MVETTNDVPTQAAANNFTNILRTSDLLTRSRNCPQSRHRIGRRLGLLARRPDVKPEVFPAACQGCQDNGGVGLHAQRNQIGRVSGRGRSISETLDLGAQHQNMVPLAWCRKVKRIQLRSGRALQDRGVVPDLATPVAHGFRKRSRTIMLVAGGGPHMCHHHHRGILSRHRERGYHGDQPDCQPVWATPGHRLYLIRHPV